LWQVDVVNDADVATLWEECAEAQRAQRHVRLYVARGDGEGDRDTAERTPPPRSADADAEATRDGTTELDSPMSAPSPLHDDGGACLLRMPHSVEASAASLRLAFAADRARLQRTRRPHGCSVDAGRGKANRATPCVWVHSINEKDSRQGP